METKHEDQETERLLPSLEEVEDNILRYKFNDKRLLEAAYAHPSFPGASPQFSFGRLEYMGDSVLNLIFAKEQLLEYPDLASGPLTQLRAANVDTEKLARVSVQHGLHRYLRHNIPLLEQQIGKFEEAIAEYPLHSNGLVDAPKVLADVVESTVGAVYIDSSFSIDTVWKVFKGLLEPLITQETVRRHPKTELYEECQKRGLTVKFVDLWEEKKAIEVYIHDQFVATETYRLKKEIAENRAAKAALKYISNIVD